jgi:Rps23 Pro-64 3,4-dihydroxylase Tpa1-like proline 4-hydroxylase
MKQSKLKENAISISEKILNAKKNNQYSNKPFQHIVIDDFLPKDIIEGLYNNFPNEKSNAWGRTNDADIEIKGRTMWESEFDIPDHVVDSVRILNSSLVLKAIGELFEVPKLMPDPYFSGGGLNITPRGGLLDVHVDGNYHDASGLNRRINVLIYLNKDWEKNWGGEFGLYDVTGDNLVKSIPPLFNRLVIFETHDYSYHGLPDKLNFPKGEYRKSLILYYYTKDKRPSSQVDVDAPHSALWKKRNGLDKRGSKTRDFN